MSLVQTRRHMLATLSTVAVAGLADGPKVLAKETAPEVSTLRIAKTDGICVAPQYVAEELLKIEGFRDIQYVDLTAGLLHRAVGTGQVDFSMGFAGSFIVEMADLPIVLLGGVHTGCYELFGTKRVRSIRDLKGKAVAVPGLGSSHHIFIASMAAFVGVDPKRDINFVIHPTDDSARLLEEEKVDALMGFPPVPQELREKKIGHVIVNSGLDRPWSQYFCCVVASNQEFVRKYPIAAKRALRAILKATNFCANEPEQAARLVAAKGYRYDHSLQTMKEIRYAGWRDYDPEDTVRFYSLRLREVGMIKSTPNRVIEQHTDWRFFNELKRELKS